MEPGEIICAALCAPLAVCIIGLVVNLVRLVILDMTKRP